MGLQMEAQNDHSDHQETICWFLGTLHFGVWKWPLGEGRTGSGAVAQGPFTVPLVAPCQEPTKMHLLGGADLEPVQR